ncbi:hypothetical protein [Tumebacillus permanentifrigoris]|uniref:DUF4367 domain-containing protein n=1 Tax=Tumebacillus permanentifrigoris TaxID=378543 RepID=A0A316DE60_9BACL|nr:hypothetical protein [Tumebacillus permanentifrigoris]PWK13957.1 hypothetical protein C7459_106255 [Tumebacillus permanentifrigoris]
MTRKQHRLICLAVLSVASGYIAGCTTKPTIVSASTIKVISTQQALSKDKQTPVESVMSQLQWVYTTNEQLSPTKKDILWEATFGNESIVTIKVPNSTYPWYNFVFLSHQGQEWNFSAIADSPCPPERTTSQKEGIALPMETFSVTKMTVGSEFRRVWTFASDIKTLVIGKYPRESFTQPEGAKALKIKDNDAWQITSDSNQTLFYYFDQGQLVWMVGNLSESELLNVAISLPSVSDPLFPSTMQPNRM